MNWAQTLEWCTQSGSGLVHAKHVRASTGLQPKGRVAEKETVSVKSSTTIRWRRGLRGSSEDESWVRSGSGTVVTG